MHLTFRPLPEWPYRRFANPDRSSFTATWTQTLVLLQTEVEALQTAEQRRGAVLLEVDAPLSAIQLNGSLNPDARVGYHGVALTLETRWGLKTFTCDRFDRPGYPVNSPPAWHANVRAIALALQSLRKVTEYGVTIAGQPSLPWFAETGMSELACG